MLEYIIMGFLSRGEKTGYDIKQEMSQSTAYFYEASYGSIYPILKKLVEKDYANVRESIEKGKFKKAYSLTELGRTSLMRWLLESPRIIESEMLVRMHFYHLLTVEQIIPLVRYYITGAERIKNELDLMDSEWGEKNPIYKGTLLYGRDYYQFQADWFRGYLKQITEQ